MWLISTLVEHTALLTSAALESKFYFPDTYCPGEVEMVCSLLRLEGSCTMELPGKGKRMGSSNVTLYIGTV
jgi:hypothetical protein